MLVQDLRKNIRKEAEEKKPNLHEIKVDFLRGLRQNSFYQALPTEDKEVVNDFINDIAWKFQSGYKLTPDDVKQKVKNFATAAGLSPQDAQKIYGVVRKLGSY